MGNQGEELLMAAYKSSNFTAGCLEIRLFYVRIASCAVDVVSDHLILRHLRREMGVSLEINGCRIPSFDTISITLRRDRIDKGSSEVTYIGTDNVRVSGTVEFEVHEEKEELILCGSLERIEGTWDNINGTWWSMDCYNAASFGSGGSVFVQSKIGVSSPSIEVYVAGCCSGVPSILTKTIQVSLRRKLFRHSMLDSIPEGEGVGKEHQYVNGFIPQQKLSKLSFWMETTPSVMDVEVINNIPSTMSTISQQQGKVTPHRRIPPKKQKRAAPPVTPNSGTTGRETSQIWDHFSKFIAKGGKCRAKCNYCTKTFAADSVNGTTTLWNHSTVKCLKSPFKSDKWQTTLKPIKRGWPEGGSTEKGVFNMDEIKRAITEFIIIDEQPFRAVEGEGFKKLMAKAFPNFEVPSRVTVARHCLRIYQEEKEKLKELIKNQRVCLTSDTWTSIQNYTYMVVTAHWIDDQWNLQKRILNFFQTSDHKGETIAKGIEDCLLGWGIENLFTVTLDNATANDAAIKSLKGRIEDWKGVMFENQFLHVRCNAHILNLIVKEGLDEQIEPISHIRSAIKYVRSSSSRFATFKFVVEKVKIDTRGLVSLDVETRWNSTYTMLDKALKFEKAFTRMYVDDQNYQKQCREISTTTKNPSTDDWKNVKAFVKFLNIFYQATLKFSGSLYSTSHSFFHDFFNLRNDIIKYTKHDDLILVDMATRMKSKMDKYWGKFESMNMLLMVAVVLDPRYKMQYVEYILSIAYGSLMGRLKSQDVRDVLNLLYNHYNCSCSEDPNENIENDNCVMGESSDLLQSQWEKHMNQEGFVVKKSDLEIYLKDDVVKINDFNILSWWKVSSSRYPIVAKIARDILSIPISTVASESAFSTGGRILDSYRSSLSPKTVEALICTQQWLRSPSKECKLEDILEEVQKIDEIEEVVSEYPDSPLRID